MDLDLVLVTRLRIASSTPRISPPRGSAPVDLPRTVRPDEHDRRPAPERVLHGIPRAGVGSLHTGLGRRGEEQVARIYDIAVARFARLGTVHHVPLAERPVLLPQWRVYYYPEAERPRCPMQLGVRTDRIAVMHLRGTILIEQHGVRAELSDRDAAARTGDSDDHDGVGLDMWKLARIRNERAS